jgi:transcriptional regulator with PAS, ATPase and Fis domain
VNCGAIPDSIIDSQLFGHARGAFSGAVSDHLGLVRAAETGTLLLDEISELPSSAQARLLRLLQEREVQPVGHSRPVPVDIRVMAATSTDLRRAVDRNKFREDLWFRLDVVVLRVKPLRQRPEQISDLLKLFNGDLGGLYQQEPLEFSDDSVDMLTQYTWPGNVRQLRTLVERLHVLCPGEAITPRHLLEIGQLPQAAPASLTRSLEEVKIEQVKRVIADSGGSVARAATVFGVHRSTIYRWLRSQK